VGLKNALFLIIAEKKKKKEISLHHSHIFTTQTFQVKFSNLKNHDGFS